MGGVTGIDPSLTGTGMAHWEPAHGWSRDTIPTKGHNTDTYQHTSRRLDRIVDRVAQHLHDTHPDLVVLEWPAYSSATGHATDRAGLFWLIAKRVEADWPATALAFCDPRGRIGWALGKFSGSKDAVLAAAIKRFPDADIRNNNEADAVLLTAMGATWLAGQPGFDRALLGVDKPTQAHLAALRRVQWPASLRG